MSVGNRRLFNRTSNSFRCEIEEQIGKRYLDRNHYFYTHFSPIIVLKRNLSECALPYFAIISTKISHQVNQLIEKKRRIIFFRNIQTYCDWIHTNRQRLNGPLLYKQVVQLNRITLIWIPKSWQRVNIHQSTDIARFNYHESSEKSERERNRRIDEKQFSLHRLGKCSFSNRRPFSANHLAPYIAIRPISKGRQTSSSEERGRREVSRATRRR